MESNGVRTNSRRVVRRRRPASACEPCRRRRVRCDHQLPCGACVRAKSPLLCEYRDGVPAGGIETGAPTRSRLMGENYPGGGQEGSSPSANTTNTQTSDSGRDNASVSRQTGPNTNLRSILSQDEQGSRVSLLSNPSLPGSSLNSPVPNPLPRLRHAPDKTKLFGQSHWVHLTDEFPIDGGFDGVEDRLTFNEAQTELLKTCRDIRSLRQVVKCHTASSNPCSLSDLVSTFPDKTTCDALVRGYMRTLEPLFRILHVPSFWRTYEKLWEHGNLAPSPSPVDIAKISLVLAMGTTFSISDDIERDRLRDLAQTWIHSAQPWLFGPGEKASNTIDGLQAFCLLFLARHTTYNCQGVTGSFSAALIQTMAMAMGLHRNPDIFPNLSSMQKQLRVRLWMTILEFVVHSSLDRSLPPGITPEGHDVPLPLNVNDSDLETPSAVEGTLVESDGFTDSSLQILLAKSLSLRLRLVQFLTDPRSNQSFDTVLEYRSQLRASSGEVLLFFRSDAILTQQTSSKSCFVAEEFHRKLLDVTLRRFTLLLHRSSMLQARKDPRFYFSRKICAESSMIILGHSGDADMSVPSRELDDFLRLSLVGRGVFRGPFSFDAMIALLLEVFTQLGGDTIPYSEVDPLDDMAKAERAPFIDRLRRTSQQLSQMIGRGSISFKRHLVLIACLCKVDAMENNKPAQPRLAEVAAAEAQRCYQILQERHPSVVPFEKPPAELEESQMPDIFPPGMGADGDAMSWDIASIFNLGAMDVLPS